MMDMVVGLADVFDIGLVGHEIRCPDLAMRMRIGAAHHGAFVLKDLQPIVTLPFFTHFISGCFIQVQSTDCYL